MRYFTYLFLVAVLSCQDSDPELKSQASYTAEENMKVLGLIGGTSWHSTIEYYQYINESVNEHFGNNTNPPLMVYTMNQAKVHKYQVENEWSGIADMLVEGGKRLQNAGVEQLMFCANTPHKVYEQVERQLNTPILHIADATAVNIKERGIEKVCFLGTKYTMTEDFITQRIVDRGIEVLVPTEPEVIEELHRIIIDELTYGKIVPESKEYVIKVIQSFVDKGVKGVILGCTEFPLMINDVDLSIPLFNTTKIHAKAGVDFILEDVEE
jgi:aspartate racemase